MAFQLTPATQVLDQGQGQGEVEYETQSPEEIISKSLLLERKYWQDVGTGEYIYYVTTDGVFHHGGTTTKQHTKNPTPNAFVLRIGYNGPKSKHWTVPYDTIREVYIKISVVERAIIDSARAMADQTNRNIDYLVKAIQKK